MKHSVPETSEAECQTVLQCTPHLLPEGENTTVQSDADVQTLVTFTPSTSDANIISKLTYTDPNDIDRDALREIDTRKGLRRTKLKWVLPDHIGSDNNMSDLISSSTFSEEDAENATVVDNTPTPGEEEASPNVEELEQPVQADPEPIKNEQKPNPELLKNGDSIDSIDETASLSSKPCRSDDLKSILRDETKKTVDEMCQTNLMVFPHILSTTDNVMVTSELAAQTSVTCVPEGSISDIIPMLKTYLVHDGKAIGTSGDSQENTSILDLIQDLIRQVENTHSHMFDPDYVPSSIPSDIDWNDETKHSDNDYFLHILDTILTSAAEPLEDRLGEDDITSVDDDYFQSIVDSMVATATGQTEDQVPAAVGGCSCNGFGFKIKILIKNNNTSSECPAIAQQENSTCFEFIVTQANDPGKQSGTCTELTTPGKEVVMPLQTGEMKIESCNMCPIQIVIKDLSGEDQDAEGGSDSPQAIVQELLYELTDSVVQMLPELESTCEYCTVGLQQNKKSRVSFAEPTEGTGLCTCANKKLSGLPNICAEESEQLKDEAKFRAEVEEANNPSNRKNKCAANKDTGPLDTEVQMGETVCRKSTDDDSLTKAELAEFKRLDSEVLEPPDFSNEEDLQLEKANPDATEAIQEIVPDSDDDYRTCSEGPCTARSKCNTKQPKKSTESAAEIPIDKSQSLPVGSCCSGLRSSSIVPNINASITDKLESSSTPCMPLTRESINSAPPSRASITSTPTPSKTSDQISTAYSCSRCAALNLPEVLEPEVSAKGIQADNTESEWIKPDPVAMALQACDEGFKPLKQAINELHQKLMMLNVPELDCIYKKDTPDTTFTKKTVLTSTLNLNRNNNMFQTYTQQWQENTPPICKALKNTNTQTSYNKSSALTTLPKKSISSYTSCSSDYSSQPTTRSGSSYNQYGSETNSSASTGSSYGRVNTKKSSKKLCKKCGRNQRQSSDDQSNYSSQRSSQTTCSRDYSDADSESSRNKKRKKKSRHKSYDDLEQNSSTSIVLSLRPCITDSGRTTIKLDKCILHNSKNGQNKKLMFRK